MSSRGEELHKKHVFSLLSFRTRIHPPDPSRSDAPLGKSIDRREASLLRPTHGACCARRGAFVAHLSKRAGSSLAEFTEQRVDFVSVFCLHPAPDLLARGRE